jgi:SAM-dependent methyltransferase
MLVSGTSQIRSTPLMGTEPHAAPPMAGSQTKPPRSAPGDHLWVLLRRGRIPLAFVQGPSEVYLIEQYRSSWSAELLRTGHAVLQFLDGTEVHGTVDLVTDPAQRRALLQEFESKYGPERIGQWFPRVGRYLRVRIHPAPGLPSDQYWDWLRQEFDSIAEDYDSHIFGNPINRYLRQRSVALLRSLFPVRSRLLEIGCGSGTETLELLREGREIVAVDISPRMVEIVKEKVRREGLSEAFQTRVCAARDLSRLVPELGPGSFEGAYSTYGALNCEPHLRPVGRAVADLLPAGRAFVAGVYNKWCLFEGFTYPLVGRIAKPFSRLMSPIPVGHSRFCIDTYAWSLHEFSRAIGPEFSVESVEGAVIVLPPSDLARYRTVLGPGPGRWERADTWLGRRWPFNRLGDHYLVTLRRRGEEGRGS